MLEQKKEQKQEENVIVLWNEKLFALSTWALYAIFFQFLKIELLNKETLMNMDRLLLLNI